MNELVPLLSQPLWVFMTVLARISPPMMLAPPTQSTAIPMRVRAGIALTMAALVTPLTYPTATAMPSNTLIIAIALAGEVLLGLLLGSIILLAFTSLQLAGQTLSHLAGLDIATASDPNSTEEMSVVSSLLGWLAMAIFVVLGGHRELFDCCLQSFAFYPAGGVQFHTSWLEELDAIVRHTFVIGIRAAAPLATALLLANLVTALLSRTLPQLNVLAVGFNINALALLVLLMVSMGSVAWLFQNELSVWITSCQRVAAFGS